MNPITNFLGNWFMTAFNDDTILITLGVIAGFSLTTWYLNKHYKGGK